MKRQLLTKNCLWLLFPAAVYTAYCVYKNKTYMIINNLRWARRNKNCFLACLRVLSATVYVTISVCNIEGVCMCLVVFYETFFSRVRKWDSKNWFLVLFCFNFTAKIVPAPHSIHTHNTQIHFAYLYYTPLNTHSHTFGFQTMFLL